MARTAALPVLEVPVSFGNLNVGDEKTRLAVSISRSKLSVAKAEKHLCGKRLEIEIVARPAGAAAEQEGLPGMEDADLKVTGIADVKGFGVTSKHISTGLTFQINSINLEELAHFAKREGRLTITSVEELDEENEGDDE